MNRFAYLANNITIKIQPVGRIQKSDENRYYIAIVFIITQNGIKYRSPELSSGMSVPITDWGKKEMRGNSSNAQTVNDSLADMLDKAKRYLEQEMSKSINTCSLIREEILKTVKIKITGNVQRGKKKAILNEIKRNTIDYVAKLYIENKTLCKDRKRQYLTVVNILHEYYNLDFKHQKNHLRAALRKKKEKLINNSPLLDGFKKKTPLITTIDKDSMGEFDKWFKENYVLTKNTSNSYRNIIISLFNYAVKKKIMGQSAIPDDFAGSFEDGNREVLSERECLQLLNLEDDALTHTEKVAKYCSLLQLLTGMGYADMKDVARTHKKFDNNEQQWYIKKNRNKTGIEFLIFLTSGAVEAFNRLSDLAPGTEDKYFLLPSIEYSSRMYKQVAEKAGIKTHITTYTYRHSFAVNYMDNDGRLEDLQKILGHKYITTTQIYGKISRKRLAQNSKKLEEKSVMHQAKK